MTTTLPAINLRAIEPEDLELLYRVENDKDMWGIGATNVPYSRYALHSFIAESSGDIYTDKQVRLIAEDERGETVGMVDLTDFDPRHLRAEVGVVVMRHRRRQGYASAALRDLADYSRRVLQLHQLYAVVGTDNDAALALFASLGYTRGCHLRQWLRTAAGYQDAWMMQLIMGES